MYMARMIFQNSLLLPPLLTTAQNFNGTNPKPQWLYMDGPQRDNFY